LAGDFGSVYGREGREKERRGRERKGEG